MMPPMPIKPPTKNEAQHFDGEALYGNPVLDSEPFNESLLGDLVTPAQIDAMDFGMSDDFGAAPSMDMGGVPMDPSAGMDQDQGMDQAPMPGAPNMASKPDMNRNDALQLLLKKAQSRDAAAGKFQASAIAANKQR